MGVKTQKDNLRSKIFNKKVKKPKWDTIQGFSYKHELIRGSTAPSDQEWYHLHNFSPALQILSTGMTYCLAGTPNAPEVWWSVFPCDFGRACGGGLSEWGIIYCFSVLKILQAVNRFRQSGLLARQSQPEHTCKGAASITLSLSSGLISVS